MNAKLSIPLLKYLPAKKESGLGQKCRCQAYYSGECGCGADWSDNRSYNVALDDVIAALQNHNIGVVPPVEQIMKILDEELSVNLKRKGLLRKAYEDGAYIMGKGDVARQIRTLMLNKESK